MSSLGASVKVVKVVKLGDFDLDCELCVSGFI